MRLKRCIKLRESQQSLIRTAKGVLGDKARALNSIHAQSVFIRCTLASATSTDFVLCCWFMLLHSQLILNCQAMDLIQNKCSK